MKEKCNLARFRIDASQIWALVAITKATRQGQVFHFVSASVLPGNDMIAVEGNFSKSFGEMTVFATVFGAITNGSLNRRLHRSAQAREAFWRSERRALALRNSSARPTLR